MTMRTFFFLTALIVSPVLASAQSLEVFALSGVAKVWDDEGNIGTGVPIGGGGGFKSPHGWGVEALVETQKATRDFDSGVHFDSTLTAGRARIIKYFGSGRTQPYAGGGLGVMRIETTRDSPAGIFQRPSTSGILSGFAGARIPIGNALFVRPEFEFSKAGEHIRLGGIVAIGGAW